jgi:lysophospholipid acyltransferase
LHTHSHIQRQIQGYEGDTTLDYSGALMIVTIKLTSFGFNISDGQRMTKEEEKKLLTPHNEQMVIELYPTWIEYFGWIYFFGGFLAGPTCEYMDYHRFIHDKTKRNTFRPALKVFLKSLVFIVILVSFGTTFNYFAALKSEWKLQYTSLPSRIGFIQLSSILTRCKYYCVWSLAEGACILSGFGFNGYDEDKKEKWDKLTNVHVLNCEFAQSYKSLAENWNIGANNWLRHYVYLRLKSGSSGATLITYVVSSMWHGFLPGYYSKFRVIECSSFY